MSTPTPREQMSTAIQDRDWNRARDVVCETVLGWPRPEALQLGLEVVRARLSAFERLETCAWPRAWLARAEAGAEPIRQRGEDSNIWSREYDGPGSVNFVVAMEALADAWAAQDARARAHRITDAVAEAVMAGLLQRWGEEHPDRWDEWSRTVWNDSARAAELQIEMFQDRMFSERERVAWTEIGELLSPPPGAPSEDS